jgi:hypothetical protein
MLLCTHAKNGLHAAEQFNPRSPPIRTSHDPGGMQRSICFSFSSFIILSAIENGRSRVVWGPVMTIAWHELGSKGMGRYKKLDEDRECISMDLVIGGSMPMPYGVMPRP